MENKIKNLKAREILNSRGNWTIEAELETEQGVFKASVPSGASKGKYEAVEIETKKAIANIETVIKPALRGEKVEEQKKIDEILIELDGTENKSNLGANAILAVSMAFCRASAAANNLPLYCYINQLYEGRGSASSKNQQFPSALPRTTESYGCKAVDEGISKSPKDILQSHGCKPMVRGLPKPCFNVLNGGVHAGNDLNIQEFILVPQLESFKENLQIGTKIYFQLKEILKKRFGQFAINLGDEGGFAPPLKKTKEALEVLIEAIKNVCYGDEVKIGLDCAASQFFKEGKYDFEGKEIEGEELLNFYQELFNSYPILFLEDPFSQDDWGKWQKLNSKCKMQNSKIFVIGDDLTVTNPKRIREAYEKKACDGVIIKPNQIGTITEAIEAVKLAKSFGWKIIVSHRSGETCDDFIADFAVGVEADFIKTGAPSRGERVAKYNRLLKIEEEISCS